MDDFSSARGCINFMAMVQTCSYKQLPRIVLGLTHWDEEVARGLFREGRRQWMLLSAEDKANAHPKDQAFLR